MDSYTLLRRKLGGDLCLDISEECEVWVDAYVYMWGWSYIQLV